MNLLKSFCEGIYSILKFQGNKNAIKYSLHSSGKCILINESSILINESSINEYIKVQINESSNVWFYVSKTPTKAKTNTSVNKMFLEEAS